MTEPITITIAETKDICFLDFDMNKNSFYDKGKKLNYFINKLNFKSRLSLRQSFPLFLKYYTKKRSKIKLFTFFLLYMRPYGNHHSIIRGVF